MRWRGQRKGMDLERQEVHDETGDKIMTFGDRTETTTPNILEPAHVR